MSESKNVVKFLEEEKKKFKEDTSLEDNEEIIHLAFVNRIQLLVSSDVEISTIQQGAISDAILVFTSVEHTFYEDCQRAMEIATYINSCYRPK